ncbi:MAG: hypothetical protein COB46_00020 [Rhodospirillaceae bacterium]|nr:MAG: hypothetical protein COB46_00020 [Rhodospirillaceae bacterium]
MEGALVVKNKQQYLNAIEAELSNGTPPSKIARKLYLSYPTFAFIDNEDLEFEIKDAISSKLAIPITSIQVAGSAKIGLSLHKKTDFDPSFSDLDIAIIDNNLFNAYLETAYRNSRGYSDGTKFKNQNNPPGFSIFKTILKNKGISKHGLV